MTEPHPFDVCGPLPTGVTLLEASAGTGKTFTIAALAARYVAAGTPLDRLLIVTFTRMATGELRERVRDRLVTAEQGLARTAQGNPPPADDEVLAVLADAPPEELRRRHRNLVRALAQFDAATIATTHGFSQHVLSGLGVAGDIERNVTLLEDPGDLIDEVVDDLYVRHSVGEGVPSFTPATARRIGHRAAREPFAEVVPRSARPGSDAALRRRLAVTARNELERRTRARRLLTYDDLLTRLAATLRDPERGPSACARLRDRYHVALVDEFQDTDPVQWEILRRAFAGPGTGTTLVLIGDPKQAIYSFRGADVFAYLDAARSATTVATLTRNWRSDQGLIDAYDVVLRQASLGHPEITYRTVRATPAHEQPGLQGVPCPAPLRVRVVHRDGDAPRLTAKGYVGVAAGRQFVAADVAADIVDVLGAGTTRVTYGPDGSVSATADLCPGDVAVLVNTNRQAALVRDALEAVGVAAVINGAGSVFGTPVAVEWLTLLEALERPASTSRARAAALTSFVGWTAAELAEAGEPALEALQARLHRWAAVLERRGVASLLELVTRTEGLPARLLARTGGERQLTDLRHVGELLHAEATVSHLGVAALATWLGQRVTGAHEDTGAEERSRRLESDADAVQVLTIHRSKGLEFPLVYVPYLWDPKWMPQGDVPVFHDLDHDGRRAIDVADPGDPDAQYHRQLYVSEERGEELRLAYVALTRARHQAVVWWAASFDSRQSALVRLLLGRDRRGQVVDTFTKPPTDRQMVTRLQELAGQVPGRISVERAGGGPSGVWEEPAAGAAGLEARRLGRDLDPAWRRTSYTAIVAGVHEPVVGSEPEVVERDDETLAGVPAALPGDGAQRHRVRLQAVPSLMGTAPAGARFGTLVHAVLERIDFAAADLEAELAGLVAEQRLGEAAALEDPAGLAAALAAAIETPLGPLAGDRRLRDLGVGDCLREVGFELPLAGGDAPAGHLDLGAVAGLLRRRLPAGDPFAAYAGHLADPALVPALRGYLSGTIDLVVRLGERFLVVDYKTNWLGADGEELSAWHYRPAAMTEAMYRGHYPLQALLYGVALHRYLRWRWPGYDPDRNLSGALYLFVRGMVGPDGPRVDGQPCGVFAWPAPPGLLAGLSDLLDQGVAP